MTFRDSIGATALVATLLTTVAGASAQEATKYPDWSGKSGSAARNGTGETRRLPGGPLCSTANLSGRHSAYGSVAIEAPATALALSELSRISHMRGLRRRSEVRRVELA